MTIFGPVCPFPMSKKLTSFVLRLKKKSQLTRQKCVHSTCNLSASLFYKTTEAKKPFPVSEGRTSKKTETIWPSLTQWCWIKIEKLHLKKAARPLMVCFLAATADEYLRASLKCIQIQKYGLSESVNSTTFSTCVCVCVGGDWNEGQTLNMQKIILLQIICEATGGMFGTMMATWCMWCSHTCYQCSTGHFHANPEVIEILNVWLQQTGKMWSSTTEAWLQIFQIYCICSRSVIRV